LNSSSAHATSCGKRKLWLGSRTYDDLTFWSFLYSIRWSVSTQGRGSLAESFTPCPGVDLWVANERLYRVDLRSWAGQSDLALHASMTRDIQVALMRHVIPEPGGLDDKVRTNRKSPAFTAGRWRPPRMAQSFGRITGSRGSRVGNLGGQSLRTTYYAPTLISDLTAYSGFQTLGHPAVWPGLPKCGTASDGCGFLIGNPHGVWSVPELLQNGIWAGFQSWQVW
jgi:hypothetical protein